MASPHLRSVSLAFLRNSLLSTTLHSASDRGSSKSCEERRGRRRKGRRRSRRGGEKERGHHLAHEWDVAAPRLVQGEHTQPALPLG